ncbi:hypothetical protein [Algoriphagus algorifonticola]|uniref:hypothetical protein n=1 Tax=Algoriphagus algorifonticola TaxID=2593007 RepID=UPI0011AADC9A|nr:hypothetical protein [Algoriphagus algorifonticola]
MNSLLHYDLMRLTAFQKNESVKNEIAINKHGELTLLKFNQVNYFNYCIGKIISLEALNLIESFYADTNDKKYQILIDAKDTFSQNILEGESKYQLKEKIAIMKLEHHEEPVFFHNEKVRLEPVTAESIDRFSWLYLECFEAENRHAESVEENFRQKLKIEGIQFYFIVYDDKFVGITGTYFDPVFSILSVAAIQKSYRNLGLHKVILTNRIKHLRIQFENRPIFSWAYKNSISHQNMIKSGMSLSEEILVYQYAV